METTLRRVGNSSGVLIPRDVRRDAGIALGDTLQLEVPRKGMIVISVKPQMEDAGAMGYLAGRRPVATREAEKAAYAEVLEEKYAHPA